MLSTRTIAVMGALIAANATAAHAQEIDMGAQTPAPTPAPSGADEAFRKGTLGFSFPFTLVSNIASNLTALDEQVPTIDLVYFLSDKAAVDLIVGASFQRKEALDGLGMSTTTNVFGFAVGAGYRMYSSKHDLRSFLEPQAVISWPDTSESDTFALNVGAQLGVERNVTPWFSISGAVGGALNFTNSFNDIQVATTANLAANLYWR